MYDSNFERDVQQKMEGLSFSPSDAVWEKVEQAVKEEKRRTPLFWLFFWPAVAAATLAGIFLLVNRQQTVTPSAMVVSSQKKDIPAAPSGQTPAPMSTPAVSDKSTSPDHSQTVSAVPMTTSGSGTEEDLAAGVQSGTGRLRKQEKNASAANNRPSQTVTARIDYSNPDLTPDEEKRTTSASSASDLTAAPLNTTVASLHGDIHTGWPMISTAKKALALTKIQVDRPSKWEAGFMGGTGIASQNQSFFHQTDLEPNLTAWVGILMQRLLTKKVSISAGMGVHYYATRVRTGDKVTNSASAVQILTALPSTTSYFYPSSTISAAAAQAYPYYTTGSGSSFTNRYYFLELPVSVQVQLNRSHVLPLFWEAGLSASYLVSADALYYNEKSGVYYNDGNVANKLQWGGSTALLAGMPLWGGRLQAGPQMQYGINRLLNTHKTGEQHLLSGGIKVVYIPRRSNR